MRVMLGDRVKLLLDYFFYPSRIDPLRCGLERFLIKETKSIAELKIILERSDILIRSVFLLDKVLL